MHSFLLPPICTHLHSSSTESSSMSHSLLPSSSREDKQALLQISSFFFTSSHHPSSTTGPILTQFYTHIFPFLLSTDTTPPLLPSTPTTSQQSMSTARSAGDASEENDQIISRIQGVYVHPGEFVHATTREREPEA